MRAGCALVLLLVGCSSAPAPSGQAALPTVAASVGDVALVLEVASTTGQKAAGLRGRAVPPGTGMAFPYPQARPVRFTMSEVTVPLVGVFSLGGVVVSVEQMAPCPGTVAQCPTYGPAGAVDLVVETAPETLPSVRSGDPVRLGP